MQTPDPSSHPQPKPSFRPCIGDIIKQKIIFSEYYTCAVVLNIYEDMLGERVYLLQNVWRLVDLQKPYLSDQSILDGLGFSKASKDDFREDFQEVLAWYQGRQKELYDSIRPFVEDISQDLPSQLRSLEVTANQRNLQLQFLKMFESKPSKRNFRPCIGDVIKNGMGGCAIVVNILEDAYGERVYHLLSPRCITDLKGPEQYTQARLDFEHFEPSTREAYQESLQIYFQIYQDTLDKIYQEVKPFVEEE